jgi:beta-glucosidase/6-phospho-beta-glucosidase/beta-galactosidase
MIFIQFPETIVWGAIMVTYQIEDAWNEDAMSCSDFLLH